MSGERKREEGGKKKELRDWVYWWADGSAMQELWVQLHIRKSIGQTKQAEEIIPKAASPAHESP